MDRCNVDGKREQKREKACPYFYASHEEEDLNDFLTSGHSSGTRARGRRVFVSVTGIEYVYLRYTITMSFYRAEIQPGEYSMYGTERTTVACFILSVSAIDKHQLFHCHDNANANANIHKASPSARDTPSPRERRSDIRTKRTMKASQSRQKRYQSSKKPRPHKPQPGDPLHRSLVHRLLAARKASKPLPATSLRKTQYISAKSKPVHELIPKTASPHTHSPPPDTRPIGQRVLGAPLYIFACVRSIIRIIVCVTWDHVMMHAHNDGNAFFQGCTQLHDGNVDE